MRSSARRGQIKTTVVMLSHCLQSAACQACKNFTPDSTAAVLLVTPLLIAERQAASRNNTVVQHCDAIAFLQCE